MVPALSPLLLRNDQVRLHQHLEMLHHGAAVQFRKMHAERPRGQRLIAQIVQNLATDFGRKGLEHLVIYFAG